MTVSEREELAQNLNTPKEILVKLSRDEHWEVRRSVALNPNTPIETLVELSKDQDQDVRENVARNPKWIRLKELGTLDQVIAASKYLGIF